jgi:hypothetical protein
VELIHSLQPLVPVWASETESSEVTGISEK